MYSMVYSQTQIPYPLSASSYTINDIHRYTLEQNHYHEKENTDLPQHRRYKYDK